MIGFIGECSLHPDILQAAEESSRLQAKTHRAHYGRLWPRQSGRRPMWYSNSVTLDQVYDATSVDELREAGVCLISAT